MKEICRSWPSDIRKSLKYFAYFMAAMVLFTFISNAASAATVAKITVTSPIQRSIADTVVFHGVIRAEGSVDIPVMDEYKVESIIHGVGSPVKSGEAILVLDLDHLREKLEELNLKLHQTQSEIQSLQVKNQILDEFDTVEDENALLGSNADSQAAKEELQQAIEAAEREYREASRDYRVARGEYDSSGDVSDVVDALTQIDKTETRLENAEKDFNNKQNIYMKLLEDGVENEKLEKARKELDKAETVLAEADKKYKDALDNYDDAIAYESSDDDNEVARAYNALRNARDTLYKARVNLEKSKQNQKNRIEKLEREFNQRELENARKQIERQDTKNQNEVMIQVLIADVKNLSKEISHLNALISAEGKLLSPADGILSRLEVEENRLIGETPVQIATTDMGYKIQGTAYADDIEELYSPLKVTAQISGEEVICSVVNIGANPEDRGGMDVELMLPEGEYQSGDEVSVCFTKTDKEYSYCVPLGAVRRDNESNFVLVMDSSKTILGIQSILRRVPIEVVMKDDMFVSISGAITHESQIVLASNKLVGEGDRVRLMED